MRLLSQDRLASGRQDYTGRDRKNKNASLSILRSYHIHKRVSWYLSTRSASLLWIISSFWIWVWAGCGRRCNVEVDDDFVNCIDWWEIFSNMWKSVHKFLCARNLFLKAILHIDCYNITCCVTVGINFKNRKNKSSCYDYILYLTSIT